ncbi:MAG: thioredoxin [Candidatus Hydrogenedentota bacterium]|nr:MAG: thioredoxin [Candidatus Hydrogenedentota bacterium]
MSDSIVQLNDENFESEVLQSKIPVLVDFWAPWCGPCRMIAPTLEELSSEYAGKIKIAKYNVDDYNKYAVEHGIRSIPALLIFKGGQVAESLVGALPKSAIAQKIDAVVG